MTVILGLNAFHGDAAACLVVNGKLVAAVEEERLRRLKHWAGFPSQAIKSCLQIAGLTLADVDHLALNRNPRANVWRKLGFVLCHRPDFAAIRRRISNAGAVGAGNMADTLNTVGDLPGAGGFRGQVHAVEHHQAHLASAFFVSPFESAALLSVDGFGDFASTMWGKGIGNRIEVAQRVHFPHSLGLFYLAITQYLGFPNYGDEYKVMGLAAYGKPRLLDAMRQIVRPTAQGGFRLNLKYFTHHSAGVNMLWQDGEPVIGPVFAPALSELLGPARAPGEKIEERHWDIAASLQAMYEEIFFHILAAAKSATGETKLCLAGGCAMNSVANGKIFERSGFTDVYIQPAAGDAGGAIGAAFQVLNGSLGKPRSFVMDHAYFGPAYDAATIAATLAGRDADLRAEHCTIETVRDEGDLCRRTAQAIADGLVVGWFQGAMEWGPRALGNRSIVGDPRRADMKDILNLKIKRRESFRPFAPSIARGAVSEWFETDYDVPFMLQVFRIRAGRRAQIPAVTHVDGTGRLQTVTPAQNARYHRLIMAFADLTGVPMVLNTSFNENEPVVCQPAEALDCFLRTKMDWLVLGDTIVRRQLAAAPAATPGSA